MHKWRSLWKSWALYSRITTPRSANMELVASLLGWSLGVSGVKGLEERENERLQVNITSQWPASQPHGWILSSAAKYFKPIFTNRGYSCTWNISLSGPLMRSDLGALEALAAEVTGSCVITSVALATLVASASSPPPLPTPCLNLRQPQTSPLQGGAVCLSF